MSDSVRPYRWQPTRLLRPWDSPGKNTGMGCHFLLQCMKVKVKSLSCVQLLATPWTVAYQAPPSMGFSRQEYWSGLPLFLLQGIFPSQGSNPGLSHCRQTLYHLSHKESPKNDFNWYSNLGGLTLKLEFIRSPPKEVFLSLARAQWGRHVSSWA